MIRLLAFLFIATLTARSQDYDVLVYGATPAGIAAALAASEGNRNVLLVEPTDRIGGLLTNGLSHTDLRTLEAMSGMFLEFTRRVVTHYGGDEKVCFHGLHAEPKVNLAVLEAMLAEKRITVWKKRSLEGVKLSGAGEDSAERSLEIALLADDENRRYPVAARFFIDASYEGDLMAAARIPYRVGREGKAEFGESLAPVEADTQLQGYNFRLCLTNVAGNRKPVPKPEGWNRADYGAVIPALEKGLLKSVFCSNSGGIYKAHLPPLPGGKYDVNDVSHGLARLSLPGENAEWPEGVGGAFVRKEDDSDVGSLVPFSRTGLRQARARVFDGHLRWNLGLLYFLQNDEAVPKKFRDEAGEWGLPADEFTDSGHVPSQLYIREARRMRGAYVFSEKDTDYAPGDARAMLNSASIATGDYGPNCHGTAHEGARIGGRHTGEFYKITAPYQIPYGVLLPPEKRGVDNLFVACAVSSTHVGFCALRMEPIWASLGQAAGAAASIAIERKCSVHRVPVAQLQARLQAAGSATIYVSDVLPGNPDFAMVQWWATAGGLHGLAAGTPGERGKNIVGQYFEAFPSHAAELEKPLDAATRERWTALAQKLGAQVSEAQQETTRGTWLRVVAKSAAEKNGVERP